MTQNAAQRIDDCGDAGVCCPYQREPLLDGTQTRLLEVLVRAAAEPEPAVIGQVEQPARALARHSDFVREDDFIAKQRESRRRTRNLHRMPHLAGNEPAGDLRELHQTDPFEQTLKRQVLSERDEVHLVVEGAHGGLMIDHIHREWTRVGIGGICRRAARCDPRP